MNPDHLLELADREINTPRPGAPRKVDLRRGVSTLYYAVFHELNRQIADAFWSQNLAVWQIHYRVLGHREAKERCELLSRQVLRPSDQRVLRGRTRFGDALRNVAQSFTDLQEARHSCDYDPQFQIDRQQANQYLAVARQAIANLRAADPNERFEFLAYLLLGRRHA